MKGLIKRALGGLGYELQRRDDAPDLHEEIPAISDNVTSTGALMDRLASIPGMITLERGTVLYLLAYALADPGDIIEIGAWQGRTTCFLAQACRDTGNGVVHAIDHFRGNTHARDLYVVERPDLSDLRDSFLHNIAKAGLADLVVLHDAASTDARDSITGEARLILVDADHEYASVAADAAAYAPLLSPHGLLVFDDYHADAPGVTSAVQEFYEAHRSEFAAPVQWARMALMRRRS